MVPKAGAFVSGFRFRVGFPTCAAKSAATEAGIVSPKSKRKDRVPRRNPPCLSYPVKSIRRDRKSRVSISAIGHRRESPFVGRNSTLAASISKVPEVAPSLRLSLAGPCQSKDAFPGLAPCIACLAASVRFASSVFAAANNTSDLPMGSKSRATQNKRVFTRVCSVARESPGV